MSIRANPFTDGHALTAAGIIARWLKTAYDDGANMEARRAMIFAAYLGGLCLNAGVVVGHSVAYTIANRTHTPHGISCTMALPYTILLQPHGHAGASEGPGRDRSEIPKRHGGGLGAVDRRSKRLPGHAPLP